MAAATVCMVFLHFMQKWELRYRLGLRIGFILYIEKKSITFWTDRNAVRRHLFFEDRFSKRRQVTPTSSDFAPLKVV